MKLSNRGLDCIIAHEGLRLKAYLDTGKPPVPTIGYGHTKGVKLGDKCTPEQATNWLYDDASEAQRQVSAGVQVTLNQNQYDALVSFVYNIGGGQWFASTLLRLLNEGNYAGAAKQFDRWIYDDGRIINGLVLRRADEKALFLNGE